MEASFFSDIICGTCLKVKITWKAVNIINRAGLQLLSFLCTIWDVAMREYSDKHRVNSKCWQENKYCLSARNFENCTGSTVKNQSLLCLRIFCPLRGTINVTEVRIRSLAKGAHLSFRRSSKKFYFCCFVLYCNAFIFSLKYFHSSNGPFEQKQNFRNIGEFQAKGSWQ